MTNWARRTVLVTGAGGFIGSHLVETLALRGARVRALVRYNSRNHWGNLESLSPKVLAEVEVVPGDLVDPACVQQAVQGCEVVFHLGALIAIPYSYVAPRQYVATNVFGTINILEACRSGDVEKLVHTSTSEVYGTALYTPIDEDHPLQAQSPYSGSKISADKMAESYFRAYGIPVAIIRPFNTYGPRQSARAVIPTVVIQAIETQQIRLGNLKPVRDLTYVTDTVEGFLAVAESPETKGEVTNIGYGKGVSVLNLASLILEILGKEGLEIISEGERVRPAKSEVFELVCNNQKAKSLLGWEPMHDLRQGLAKTIEWVQQNLARMKSHLYNI